MEYKTIVVRVLGDQYRYVDGDHVQPSADRTAADISVGQRRLLVRSKPRVHADEHHANIAMDASVRRHGIRDRSGCICLVRNQPDDNATTDRTGADSSTGGGVSMLKDVESRAD